MANPKHLAILKKGVAAWNQWRENSPEIVPNLSWADLNNASLSGANLSEAVLLGAGLCEANLHEANLMLASLTDAQLRDADLSSVNLFQSNFYGANLSGVNLNAAHLIGAVLAEANLDRAMLSKSTLGWTTLATLDLSTANGLESVVHESPSSVGIDTLALTLRGAGGRFTEEQLIFFEGAGVPNTLLEYLPGILESNPIQFFSCVISYSTEDENFADRLNQDLNEAGIRTWKWDRDAVRGRDLHQSIDRAIRQYDKTILVCSVNSLTSPQVEPEIVAALDKEKRIKANNLERRREAQAAGEPPPQVDADVLIPIRLDDTIFKWDSHLKIEVSRRMISDFTDAPPDSEKYRDELQQLLHALDPKAWPPQLAASQNP